jgi:hypothetical protein
VEEKLQDGVFCNAQNYHFSDTSRVRSRVKRDDVNNDKSSILFIKKEKEKEKRNQNKSNITMHDESCLRELGNTCSRTNRIHHYENLKKRRL